MKGYAERRLELMAWEIFLGDRDNVYTIEFKQHKRATEMQKSETTILSIQSIPLLKALAEAMQEMGVLQENGTTAELKATKYHLEDMRKLALK